MTTMTNDCSPFESELEKVGVADLKKELKGSLPKDLDTDFELIRWYRYYQGQTDELKTNLLAHVANRRAWKIDDPNFEQRFWESPLVRRYWKYFRLSKPTETQVDRTTDNIVFVEIASPQFKEATRVIKCSDYLYLSIGYCEYTMRKIRRLEVETGRLHSATIIFDLHHVNLWDYVNPMAPLNRYFLLRTQQWEAHYPGMVSQIILYRPPRIAKLTWRVIKLFLNEKSLQMLNLVDDEEALHEYVKPSFLPISYGGKAVDTSGYANPPESLCSPRTPITNAHYYKSGSLWSELSLTLPSTKSYSIKAGRSLEIDHTVTQIGVKLLWHFSSNCDMHFSVCRGAKLCTPKLLLNTALTPEEGVIECENTGTYTFHFLNSSRLFSARLNFVAATK